MEIHRPSSPPWTALALALAACAGPGAADGSPLVLEVGVRPDGYATPAWRTARADSLDAAEAARLERKPLPLSPGQRAWLAVLEGAVPRVADRVDELAEPFDVAPVPAVVVAGNGTNRDAFAWDGRYIGVDLGAFHRAYGPPDADALERATRILVHEYVHLLTHARDRRDPAPRATPLDRALWTLYLEGLGDYHSLSSRWLPGPDGSPSRAAAGALARLEPVLVERLEALERATPDEEARLRANIAMGRFDAKWGSLPVALWLRSEAAVRGERETLTAFARGGPAAVLPLAARHVRPELRPRVEALAAATR